MDKNFQILHNICAEIIYGNFELYLFGSRSGLDFSEDSDYDIMLVTQTAYSQTDIRSFKAKIRKVASKNKIPTDVIIYNRAEYQRNVNITGHIAKQAAKDAILI